jgi:hypothetical protein
VIAPRAGRALLALTLGILASACQTAQVRDERASWRAEWNGRIERAASDWEHPCATRPFIAWADTFLAECQDEKPGPRCQARWDWVEARVAQCRAWTAWQLRNFNQHERTEGTPPSMRIE